MTTPKKPAPIWNPNHPTGSRIVSAAYFGGSADDYAPPLAGDERDLPAELAESDPACARPDDDGCTHDPCISGLTADA